MPDRPSHQIHHAHALLLLLGSDAYTTVKASSSIIASLVAGAPVVADAATLRAYSFIPADAAFVMKPGEDEVDAMLRVRRGWEDVRAGEKRDASSL